MCDGYSDEQGRTVTISKEADKGAGEHRTGQWGNAANAVRYGGAWRLLRRGVDEARHEVMPKSSPAPCGDSIDEKKAEGLPVLQNPS